MRKTILLLALLSVIVFMTSCQKAEEVTVTKYLQAMAHNDKTTMATMAFKPVDIEYKSYEVLSIEEPVVGELQLPVLTKNLADTDKKRKEQVMRVMDMSTEMDDAEYELEETRRRSKRAELQKKIDELKEVVEEETQKVKSLQLEINKTKKAIEEEKALIILSTGMRENLEMFTGETLHTKVTVKITPETGEPKDYIFWLRKDILKLEGREQEGRLIVEKLMTAEDFDKTEQEKAAEATTEEVTEPEPATEEKTEESTEG
jgi:ABC-type lipoprotein release transport system permease subunit